MKRSAGLTGLPAAVLSISVGGCLCKMDIPTEFPTPPPKRVLSGPEDDTLLDSRVSARDSDGLSGVPLLLKFMADSNPEAKRLKGLLPKGTVVAHKTGTSGTQNGITAATNDIGIIWLPNGKHAAIAVFVSDSPADEKTREAVIAKIAKAVWDKWSK